MGIAIMSLMMAISACFLMSNHRDGELKSSQQSGMPLSVLAVDYLNYGVIGGVQISSLTDARITIKSVLINNEFYPSLFTPSPYTPYFGRFLSF